jgi:hypothetical protein
MRGNCLSHVESRLFHSAHEISRAYPICVGEPNDCSERWALNASFQRAQDGPVYAEFYEHIQLGQPSRLANFTQDAAKGPFRA